MSRRRRLTFGQRLVAFLIATFIAVPGIAMCIAPTNQGERIQAAYAGFVAVLGLAGMVMVTVNAVRATRTAHRPDDLD
jgi:hypothetical protein